MDTEKSSTDTLSISIQTTPDLSDSSSVTELLKEVQGLYDLAEKRIKQVEVIGQGLILPAVNALRYAGRHLVDAVNFDTDCDPEDELNKAKKHCRRSIYDASEAGVIFLRKKISSIPYSV